jgi:hypothetical protein
MAALKDRGRLVEGAKALAFLVYEDEEKWRSMYAPDIRQDLGLFMLNHRLVGYEGVINARLAQKLAAAFTQVTRRRRQRYAAQAEATA